MADNKRADTLLQLMQYIEGFTLQRAWVDLSDEELFWEPVGERGVSAGAATARRLHPSARASGCATSIST